MSKTIVNIIDKSNPLPAYLFTKEYYEKGDVLLFISNEEEAECIDHLAKQLEVDEHLSNASSSNGMRIRCSMSISVVPSKAS